MTIPAVCPICRTACGRTALECLLHQQRGYEGRLLRLEGLLLTPKKLQLGTRQRQVADLVAQGYSGVAIAVRLGVSPATVKRDKRSVQVAACREAEHANKG